MESLGESGWQYRQIKVRDDLDRRVDIVGISEFYLPGDTKFSRQVVASFSGLPRGR